MKKLELQLEFPGKTHDIETHVNDLTIRTSDNLIDPSPGKIFLAGLAACTASTARGYCEKHGLPLPTGMKATINYHNEKNIISEYNCEFIVPTDFPKEKVEALIRAAGTCTVKNFWRNPPEFHTSVIASK
ncbi:MAG: OsmC family protein [Anaerolineaceae bacterium]|nr:OsmC family protein [Anaerolineaceae bacterium]